MIKQSGKKDVESIQQSGIKENKERPANNQA